jgi:hypothetical protein
MSSIKSTAQELVGVLFLARDVAHRAHLNTDSYSQHMALGAFYDNIIGLADKFTEAWMGRNKKKIGNIPYMTAPDSEILKQLEVMLDVVKESRSFADDDSMLSNIIDEVEAEFCSAIYKLKFLK